MWQCLFCCQQQKLCWEYFAIQTISNLPLSTYNSWVHDTSSVVNLVEWEVTVQLVVDLNSWTVQLVIDSAFTIVGFASTDNTFDWKLIMYILFSYTYFENQTQFYILGKVLDQG